MSDPTPIMETQRKDTPMKEQLFFCESCEGSALVQITKNNVRVTPCQCQFEEDN